MVRESIHCSRFPAKCPAALRDSRLPGLITLWQLWILVAIHGVGVALFIPASGAFVPEIVPTELLVEANAVRQFVRPLAMRLVGPALGGVLVAVLGAGEAFLLDSLSF